MDYRLHSLENLLFISEDQQQKTSDEIHSLTVLYLWIEKGVSFQNPTEHLRLYDLSLGKRSLHIHIDDFLHFLDHFVVQGYLVSESVVITLVLSDV